MPSNFPPNQAPPKAKTHRDKTVLFTPPLSSSSSSSSSSSTRHLYLRRNTPTTPPTMDDINDNIPSSPTVSSISSSDLDTESTGSFFHDRSTTLGTLMGVSFQTIAARVSSRREGRGQGQEEVGGAELGRRERRRGQGRRWWWFCREEAEEGGRVATSLAEFLEIERRLGDVPGGNALFSDGRVLPPPAAVAARSPAASSCGMTGICCGGG